MINMLEAINKINEDTKKFWNAINNVQEQSWYLEHEIIFDNEFEQILLHEPDSELNNNQVIILNPPRAGHHSNIGCPLTKMFLSIGYTVLVINHLEATQSTKNLIMGDMVNGVEQSYSYITRENKFDKIHVVGLCQGGYVCAIWHALNPSAKVDSLTIAGSPIDFKIDGGKLQDWLSMMPDYYFESIVKNNDGIWPGNQQLLGFKMLNPIDRFLGTYIDLADNIINDKDVSKWIRNNSWYESVYDMPGNLITETVIKDLFRGNKLIRGELVVNNQKVDLSNIEANQTIHKHLSNCGHIAIYLKRSAIDEWREIFTKLQTQKGKTVVTLTGDNDDITLERQCKALLDYITII